MSFFERHNILNQNQYGFQKNLSTIHAILDAVNQIANNIKQKKLTGLIFLDLIKAFETVSHEFLLKKLDHYGIEEKLTIYLDLT